MCANHFEWVASVILKGRAKKKKSLFPNVTWKQNKTKKKSASSLETDLKKSLMDCQELFILCVYVCLQMCWGGSVYVLHPPLTVFIFIYQFIWAIYFSFHWFYFILFHSILLFELEKKNVVTIMVSTPSIWLTIPYECSFETSYLDYLNSFTSQSVEIHSSLPFALLSPYACIFSFSPLSLTRFVTSVKLFVTWPWYGYVK